MIGWLIVFGSVLLYGVGAAFGWRVGYVSGYEASTSSWDDGKHSDGVRRGQTSAAFWPVALPALLVAMHFTPTPPSVIAEENERLLKAQRREIERLEREAGIQ